MNGNIVCQKTGLIDGNEYDTGLIWDWYIDTLTITMMEINKFNLSMF